MINSRPLNYIAGIALLVVFVGSVGPLLMLPFVNILPYLQTKPLPVRLVWSVTVWIFVWGIWFFSSTPQQKKSLLPLVRGWRNISGVALGMSMFVFFSAFLSANMFGALVKAFPADSYEAEAEIVLLTSPGAKYKAINLSLRLRNDEMVYLTLSKRLFDYSKLDVGQTLLLKGRQNLFGVYVERVAAAVPEHYR